MDPIVSAIATAELKRRAARRARAIVAGTAGTTAAGGLVMLLMIGGAVGGSVPEKPAVGQKDTVCPLGTIPVPTGGQTGRLVLEGKPLSADRLANARTIIAVGNSRKIPARGIQVALATAIQESKLDNLDWGDRDSVGLFQQRPSQGWGTVQQIMNPAYAAGKFYDALVQVPGWQQMSLTRAAQAVQRSGFPDAYAQWEILAGQLMGAPGLSGVVCMPVAPVGSTFGTGSQAIQLPRANPRSVSQAIAWARAEAASGRLIWDNRCLASVAIAYGWSFSGTPYAIDHYRVTIPTSMRHDGDRNPPPGALLFWDTGRRAGHVALSLGGGMIASNDIVTQGAISIVPADQIEKKWGARYLGWAPPYFPGGG